MNDEMTSNRIFAAACESNDVMSVNGKNRRIALKLVNYRGKFNSWLNPSVFKVFSFKIQKSSRLSRVLVTS